jgi:hypothetical protein
MGRAARLEIEITGRRGGGEDRYGEGYDAWHMREARTHFSFGGPNKKCLPESETG